jgi:hypothetical protein
MRLSGDCNDPSYIYLENDADNSDYWYSINLNNNSSYLNYDNWETDEYLSFNGSPDSINFNSENYTLMIIDTLIGNSSLIYVDGILTGAVVTANSSGFSAIDSREYFRDSDEYAEIKFENSGTWSFTDFDEEYGYTMGGQWSLSNSAVLTLSNDLYPGDDMEFEALMSAGQLVLVSEYNECDYYYEYENNCYEWIADDLCGLETEQISGVKEVGAFYLNKVQGSLRSSVTENIEKKIVKKSLRDIFQNKFHKKHEKRNK